MVSIVSSILKDALGFLVKKGRGYVADKLKDGDVVDQKLSSWILNEIESINLKLDAGAKSDLGASLSSLKEGFILLNVVLVKDDQSCDDSTETSDEGGEAEGTRLQSDSHTSAACLSCITSFFTGKMKNLQISNLGHSKKEALSEAKKRFSEARFHATKAFSNNALALLDRVLAMNVRLMATILEKVENPAIVLSVCRSCLEDLHRMPEVEKNFLVEVTGGIRAKVSKEQRGQIISTVCQINRLVYDVTKMVGDGKGLLLWPYIKVNDEKIDPLRDSRVARTLRKQNMDHCCLTRSFGQQEDEEQRSLKSATGIATNSLGQLLVIDRVDGVIKVFDTTGRFLSSLSVPAPQEHVVGNFKPELKSIDTDRNDNIYVLQVTVTSALSFINQIFVFDKNAKIQHKFDCGHKTFCANIVRVIHDHSLLVLGHEFDIEATPNELLDKVCPIYKSKMRDESGDYRATIGNRTWIEISNFVDIVILSDNHAMVLGSDCVYVIKDCSFGFHLGKDGIDELFSLSPTINACAMAYHHISEQIIIVSHSEKPEIPSLVSIYNKDGTFDRSIHFEVERNYRIKGVSVTRDGLICISADSEDPPIGKVIVL